MINKKVPHSALFFAGAMAMPATETTDPMAPKPITVIASTGGVCFQEFWGKCIFNMAGYKPSNGPVPLDYDHKDDVAIGVADSIAIVDGKLVATGRLTPFRPDDNASEVIAKGALGVPYQASVRMDFSRLKATEIPPGKSTKVNGIKFDGPGYVFDEWGVSGIAITPYGADSSTSVEFAAGSPDVEVSVTQFKESTVVEAVATPAVAPVVAAPSGPSGDDIRNEMLKFKTDFGAAGIDWYFEKKTYSEAAALFAASIKAEAEATKQKLEAELKAKDDALAAITAERDEFKKKSEFNRGQATPVPVKPGEESKTEEKPNLLNFGRSQTTQAIIDGIAKKMPK